MPKLEIILIIFFFITILIIVFFSFLLIRNNFRLYYLDLKKVLRKGKWHPKEVGVYYDDWIEAYQEYYGEVIQAHRPVHIEDLYKFITEHANIKDGQKILDAGCGFCGPSIYFAEKLNIHVDAVNISQKQLQIAQDKINIKGLNNIHLTHGDFHEVHNYFEHNYFDRILFLESYGHSTDQKKVLTSAVKVLKKGGWIYIKDYFINYSMQDKEQNELVKVGVNNMNRYFHYNTADLYYTIYVLIGLGLRLVSISRVSFNDWDNHKVIDSFHERFNIDLNEGIPYKDAFVLPYELIFEKR